MSYELACKLSNKVAAITSVKGAMLAAQIDNCNPSRAVPILEIHGTEDRNVPYDWAINAINFWIGHNGTSGTPIIIDLPDTKPNNGNTAQHYLYEAGLSSIGVEHIRVNGGVHDWFGSRVQAMILMLHWKLGSFSCNTTSMGRDK
jgi:polyhydroxybutyrate depolymerase